MIFIRKILIYLIRGYQVTPLHSHSMCRFTPTCSNYMIDAIETYGVCKGLKLGIKRLLKCHPHGKYGIDNLKEKEDGK